MLNQEKMKMLMEQFKLNNKTSDSFNKIADTYLEVHKDAQENWVDISPSAFMWMTDAVKDIENKS